MSRYASTWTVCRYTGRREDPGARGDNTKPVHYGQLGNPDGPEPLYGEPKKHLLESRVIYTDETVAQVLKENGKPWLYRLPSNRQLTTRDFALTTSGFQDMS